MIRRAKPLLGTLVEVTVVPNEANNTQQINMAIAAAFQRIEDISHQLSFHSPSSELSRLNAAPGQWCPMSRDGIRLLRLSRALGEMTDNRFNCTVGGELVAKGALPNIFTHPFIAQGSWQDIAITHTSAKLIKPVLITLDGIAKGYAVDVAVAVLKHHGISNGWINAGGDLKVFGSVALPVQQRQQHGLSASIQLQNSALASSRLTKTFDKNYPALIIAHNKLADISNAIISIQAPFAWRADALTKIGASMSAKSQQLVSQLGGKIIKFEQNGQ